MDFRKKTTIITGAAKGIGRSLSFAYAKAGATVVLIDHDEEALKETRDQIKKAGGEAHAFPLDLVDVQAVENVFQNIMASIGRCDILINNAGLGITKSIDDLPTEEWDYVINTNLSGTFVCSKEASKIMRENGGGSIINIASTRALMSEADTFPYSASKGGIVSLTHSLAVSLGKYKIRVNCISPGWIETGDYGKLRDIDHRQHPAGRVGRPEDIVKACFYLSDQENDFVTGANLVVDGGMTSKMIYEH